MATATSLDAPSTQIFYRIQPGWQMCAQNDAGKVSSPSQLTPSMDHDFVFSPDGSLIASIIENQVQIFDANTGELLFTIDHPRVRNVYFSPLNTYVFTYHRRVSADGNNGNFVGWQLYEPCDTQGARDVLPPRDFINPEHQPVEVMRLFVKDFDSNNPVISFSGDERIAARVVKDGIIILHGRNLNGRPIIKETIESVANVSCAPTFNHTPLSLAVFIPIKKGRPANVSIYTLNKNRLFRGATRSFYDVDTVKFVWNNRGDCVLVFASSDVDTSGQSYYGHNSLYLFHTEDNLTAQMPIARNGKLQNVAWHPGSREFVMIDDHPMKISAFDWKGGLKHSFGTYARNMVRFSPRGRFMWAGGFGNLNGEMDFWEYKTRTHLGYAEDESCRYFSWSPDGKTFITARTYPLRTVDNGYRVYKYNGQKLLDVPFERLYQIAYRPNILHRPTWQDRSVFGQKERSPSPGAVRVGSQNAAKPKMKKAYVPPHMRNRGGGGGRGRGGRGGSTKRQKHIVGLGFVDVPDSDASMSLSERLSNRADSQGRQQQQSGSGKKRRNRRKGKQQQNDGESKEAESGRRSSYSQQREQQQQQQQQNDEDDGTFWPRGEKFGVVEKNGNDAPASSGKKRKRKRKRKNAGAVSASSPTDGDNGGDDTVAGASDAPSREDVAAE